jgi:aspartate ammonia-lyase
MGNSFSVFPKDTFHICRNCADQKEGCVGLPGGSLKKLLSPSRTLIDALVFHVGYEASTSIGKKTLATRDGKLYSEIVKIIKLISRNILKWDVWE